MRESLRDFCLREEREELLRQWDEAANAPLTPDTVSYGSKRKVWWRCDRGHTWQSAVYARTGDGTGCPVCTGKVAVPGENDLATRYPDLAAQWHPTRNGSLTPDQVLPGSHRMVWWVCERGHIWRAQVKSRVSGCGCPVCANREVRRDQNSLASRYPDLAAQWHSAKNGTLTPDQVSPGTRRKVWWQCAKGHQWQASIAARMAGSGCPVCAGHQVEAGENDLASQFPVIAAQWHPTKNGSLTPRQVSPASNKKVWWQCQRGHSYEATVVARTVHGSGCPYCAGKRVLAGYNDLASLEPEIAGEWHPTLNGTLTPEMVTAGCHRKVWWRCSLGHVWKAMVYSRAGPQRSGCPICAGTVKGRRLERYERLMAEAAAALAGSEALCDGRPAR